MLIVNQLHVAYKRIWTSVPTKYKIIHECRNVVINKVWVEAVFCMSKVLLHFCWKFCDLVLLLRPLSHVSSNFDLVRIMLAMARTKR